MLFTLTTAGLAAINNQKSGGPSVQVTNFKVGSAYGYTPSASDTALHGTVLYPTGAQTAVPSNYYVQSSNVVVWSLVMDDSVGDFDFGEVGLYLADGTLFALATYSALQTKTKSTTAQAGNTVQLLAKVQESLVAPTIDFSTITATGGALVEVADVNLLNQPSAQSSNIYRTATLQDEYGRALLAIKDTNTGWQVPQMNWKVIKAGSVTGASDYSILAGALTNTALDMVTGRYLVQFTSGALVGTIRMLIPAPVFVANATYEVNQIVVPTTGNGHQYLVTVGGLASTEPTTWPTGSGSTVVSGAVTFEEYGAPNSQGVSWDGSTGSPAAAGDTFDIYRAFDPTDLDRYITEYRQRSAGMEFFNTHN